MHDVQLAVNGIDGATGLPLLPPITLDRLTEIIRGAPRQPEVERELRWWVESYLKWPPRGIKAGRDPARLDEAGWGVVFAAGDPRVDAVREALGELLEHRRAQATAHDERLFKVYAGADGYLEGESKLDFLARHDAGPGPADPENVPYYLLLVGDPETIPYRVQYQLDVQYAVGRIHFDTADEYAAYARGVVASETGAVRPPERRLTLFSVRTEGDPATELGTDLLVRPLAEKLGEGKGAPAKRHGWQVETIPFAATTRQRLGELLRGAERPAVLFTLSHGVGFAADDSRQADFQGALLCQDWPGPGSCKREHYFAAEDVDGDAGPAGMITFHFACYGAGMPRHDEFAHALGERAELAPRAFVARLPQRLLGHPRGGALAVVGHIERGWGYSFGWPGAGAQPASFESLLATLFAGKPLGMAMEYFNQRYAELACELSAELEELEFGRKADSTRITRLWTAHNDARNYVVVGDPAVRVPAPVGPS